MICGRMDLGMIAEFLKPGMIVLLQRGILEAV